mmetsp:Transcript_60098/g.196249  ORF Transcript_60098/g.196249 Transcript_60098/m.196249 type:complete len:301 (-) Transcript_60098:8-910(-)
MQGLVRKKAANRKASSCRRPLRSGGLRLGARGERLECADALHSTGLESCDARGRLVEQLVEGAVKPEQRDAGDRAGHEKLEEPQRPEQQLQEPEGGPSQELRQEATVPLGRHAEWESHHDVHRDVRGGPGAASAHEANERARNPARGDHEAPEVDHRGIHFGSLANPLLNQQATCHGQGAQEAVQDMAVCLTLHRHHIHAQACDVRARIDAVQLRKPGRDGRGGAEDLAEGVPLWQTRMRCRHSLRVGNRLPPTKKLPLHPNVGDQSTRQDSHVGSCHVEMPDGGWRLNHFPVGSPFLLV